MSEDMLKVIASVDRSWPRDYIIRFLYINLAYCFERDIHFFLATKEEQLAQYKKGFIKHEKYIVCSTLIDHYIKALAVFGIKARKITATSTQIPLFAMIVEGQLGYYFLDPLNDLFRIQYGLKTCYFGRHSPYKLVKDNHPYLRSIDEDYLKKIDSDLKVHPNNINTSDIFDVLREEVIVRSISSRFFDVDPNDSYGLTIKKLEFIKDHLINLGKVEGIIERNMMYGFIRGKLFDRLERSHTDVVFNFDEPFNIKTNFVVSYPNHEQIVFEDYTDSKGQFKLERIK